MPFTRLKNPPSPSRVWITRNVEGQLELRGQPRPYKIVDYVNNKDYGTVTGPTAKLNAALPQPIAGSHAAAEYA